MGLRFISQRDFFILTLLTKNWIVDETLFFIKKPLKKFLFLGVEK